MIEIYKCFTNVLHLRSDGVEPVVITLFLLFHVWSIFLLLADRTKPTRTPMSPPRADECIDPAKYKLVTESNVERVIRCNAQNYETATLKRISIYSTPLSAPFKSSKSRICSYLQRQFSPVDYHSFIILETSDGMCWALDKMKDGIYFSWGISRDSVLFYFKEEPRPTPVLLIAQDQSTVSIRRIVNHLKYILPGNLYQLIESNCQHFTKAIFDKFAENEIWKLTTPTDLTSPLTLFSDGGNPFLLLSFFTSFFFEIYLLLNNGLENDSLHYYQCLVGILILVSPIMIYLTNKTDLHDIGIAIFLMLLLVLKAEGIFYTPLGTVRKRGAQYVKIWRSVSVIYKLLLPLSYTMFYGIPLYTMFIFLILSSWSFFWNLLPTQITSPLSGLKNICSRLTDLLLKGGFRAIFLALYVVTVICFYLQE